MTTRAFMLMASLVAGSVAPPAHADPTQEQGTGIYRVVINGADEMLVHGNWGAFGGPDHPASILVGRPAQITTVTPRCPGCPLYDDITHMTVRAWDLATDYRLGDSLDGLLQPEPGYACVDASEMAPPSIVPVLLGGENRGVAATWVITSGALAIRAEQRVVVHGNDPVDAAVEVTLTITNIGAAPAALGIRQFVPARTKIPPALGGGALADWHVVRLRDALAAEPPFTHEVTWAGDELSGWQVNPGGFAFPSPWATYHVGGRVAPSPSLDPQPTPPELLQALRSNKAESTAPGTDGMLDRCFNYVPPSTPRDLIFDVDQGVIVSTWGATPASAIVLPPGAELRTTQYLVAYVRHPLEVRTSGPYAEPCAGGVTRVTVHAEPVTLLPTSGTFRYRWSSPDPRVTFADPAAPDTDVVVAGSGTFPVTVSAYIGALEASSTTTIDVRDVTPPAFVELRASPETLWPPNHRHVVVNIAATIEDECDPAPSLRLVRVVSSELDDTRGDGRTLGDVSGATLGTDDRQVLLRAERDGRGGGRTYELTYEARDAAGNVAERSVTVSVPHARRTR